MNKNQVYLKKQHYIYSLKNKKKITTNFLKETLYLKFRKLIKEKKNNVQKIFHKLKKINAYRIFIVKYLTTFNNSHISIHTPDNTMLYTLSSGVAGFKRLQKSTKFATFKTTLQIVKKLKKTYKVKYIKVYIKGLGRYKKTIFNVLKQNFKIVYVVDNNKYKHNGCKLKKKARK